VAAPGANRILFVTRPSHPGLMRWNALLRFRSENSVPVCVRRALLQALNSLGKGL